MSVHSTFFCQDRLASKITIKSASTIVEIQKAVLNAKKNTDFSKKIMAIGVTWGTSAEEKIYKFKWHSIDTLANPLSKKKQYSQIANSGGSYSIQSLKKIVDSENCPNSDTIVRPPTNSGVYDYKYPGYYYDNNVPYLPSL